MIDNAVAERVLAVVVVHERPWSAVRAAATLSNWVGQSEDDRAHQRLTLAAVLVYDNSNQPIGRPPEHDRVRYVHAPVNGGTRAAYEEAAAWGMREQIEWILVLDQDTELPPQYLRVASESVRPASLVLAPILLSHNRVVSPGRFTRLGRVVQLARPSSSGAADGNKVAIPASRPSDLLAPIASGILIRSRALQSVRNVPGALWLDYVDHALFFRLQQQGAKIETMPVEIQHDLSVSQPSYIQRERLAEIWRAECLFVRNFGALASVALRFRQLLRLIRMSALFPRRARDAWYAWRSSNCAWPIDTVGY